MSTQLRFLVGERKIKKKEKKEEQPGKLVENKENDKTVAAPTPSAALAHENV